ncbi:hypothetical protein [Burkholderia sp. S171]|uniref:hypothetical protein n=1 Tax=Burkholderia sp. S171 TaxID=1641860 RepID=UPI00131C2674|nr:hypothetical protein [Burkholderia sp. S171]
MTQTSTQTSRRDFIDDLDALIPPPVYETQPQFLPLRMNETLSLRPCTPATGEIFVFRFRSQWQRVSAHDSAQWLTQDETRRAALLPSPALRYRYISSRAVLRLAVARILGCQPDAVDLRDDAKGRMVAQDATGETVLCADIAYAGVWIMLGISASYLGLGTSLPSLASSQVLPSSDSLLFSNQRARDNSVLSAAGHRSAIDHSNLALSESVAALASVSKGEPWYVFELPMPGQLCASVCSSKPLSTILAFGWSKRNDA